ncbi:ABC transporter substrate-binding protein [Bosea sp. BH3]|uniref:ABC transporter substrate-binding protein n=1 Tax=Bosea sp. BH3 TaxID=2871701 RepID=UPI0021CB4205|nr:ABC transporter substrate-binding protein [Bosea sp. BH3]MCU4179743.1 ABC transporter substrate-binding protein [Bosea sp. BH3]
MSDLLKTTRISRRQALAGLGVGAATGLIASPSIILAQTPDVIRFGHLTPRTGFLGPLGEYGVMAADLAVEEINAAGGINGRKLEALKEDSVNPQTASTKAERMIERDKVACIIGEISSASALTIAQVAGRTKTLFVNTGANSDALRGESCNRYMFHVEHQNSMYVKSCGRSLMQQGLVKGKKWFSLTADYAFGHDLLKVAKRFMESNGGQFAADKLVPTDATDFSALLLEIRAAKPDLVISNLAGNQITNFLKQYSEFGLTFPVAGFGFDTALAWAAGKDNFGGTWPSVWHHLIDTPSTKTFVAAFTKKYGKPPENQAWGDYIAVKIMAQSMNELKSADTPKILDHLEKGAKFDVMKPRQGYFRASDHQLISEMYTITALPAAQVKNQWDLFTSSPPVPGPDENMEVIATSGDEAVCKMS